MTWMRCLPTGHETAAWHRENRAAYRYRTLSDAESGTVRQVLYLDLATRAENQARLWRQEARKSGMAPHESWEPGLPDLAGNALIHALGPRWAGWFFWRLALPGHGLYGRFHPSALGRILTGMIDGVVSNACLLLGVASLTQERPALAMTGLLGLLFGAGLSGLGEWLVTARQQQRLGREGVPPDHLREGEEAGLVALLVGRGLSESRAGRLVRALHDDPDRVLPRLALVVKGMAPGDHDPPHGAALIGLLAFAAGALIPLLGLYLGAAEWALPMAAGASAMALWGMGVRRAVLAGKPARAGLRSLLLGGAAAFCAWGVGWGLARYF